MSCLGNRTNEEEDLKGRRRGRALKQRFFFIGSLFDPLLFEVWDVVHFHENRKHVADDDGLIGKLKIVFLMRK